MKNVIEVHEKVLFLTTIFFVIYITGCTEAQCDHVDLTIGIKN